MTIELPTVRPQITRPTLTKRSKLIGCGAFAVVAYLAVASYLTITYRDEVPHRADLAEIYQIVPTGTPGTYAAHVWLPIQVTHATVFENGVFLADANAVYDDPSRTFSAGSRHWKFVEFNATGDVINNPERKRYWIIFR